MIDLYTWLTPNGRKVSILLEELGVDYAVHGVDIGKGQQKEPAFLALSPNGRIPAIYDREAGRSVFESGAILLYLAEKFGRFGGGAEHRVEVVEWLMWQMGGLGPMAGQAHHFLQFNAGVAPYAEARYGEEVRRLYGVLDRRLADRAHVAGPFSIAEMAIWPWVSRFEWQRVDLKAYPNVKRWYLELRERPAVRRGYHVPREVGDIPAP
ncbi:MAG: glutathione S-transferase N-terminal domain-containing protein [Pseudomonadota bacterium]